MANKKFGRHSQQANDFLQPNSITGFTATNVGTNRPYTSTASSSTPANGTGGAATLSWDAPSDPQPTTYSITTTPSTYTATVSAPATSYTFQGLASNTSYTFTVVATNAAGSSSGTTSSSTLITTIPAVPSAPSATAQVNQDSVTWSAPANGGSAITQYTLKSSDGPTYNTANTSYTVSETANTSQTYQVLATNANGSTAYSASSNQVTTLAPYFPYFPYFPPFFPPWFPFFPPFFPFFPPYFPPFFPPFFPYFPPFFPPFFPPYFSRTCIDKDTVVLTTEGEKPISEIQIGDKLVTILIPELSTDQENIASPFTWSSESLQAIEITETEVVTIIPSQKVDRIYFNDMQDVKFTYEHPIFIKKNDEYRIVQASYVNEGDYILKLNSDNSITEILVESITTEILEEASDVYNLSCEPYDWYFAGGMLVHNK